MKRIKGSKYQGIKMLSIFFLILSTINSQLSTSYAAPDGVSIEKLFLEGRYEKVIQEADRLINSFASNRDEIYYLKALSELKLNRFKDSRETLEYLLSKYPRSKMTFEAHIAIGDSYFLEGNADKALGSYNDVLSDFPNDKNIAIAYYRIGACHSKLGSDEKARQYSDKAKALSPLSFERGAISPDFTPREIPRGETGGYFSVQTGCFKNKRNAERFSQKLRDDGYGSYVETPSSIVGGLYRVKIGRFKEKLDAEALASRLKKDGYKTKISADGM